MLMSMICLEYTRLEAIIGMFLFSISLYLGSVSLVSSLSVILHLGSLNQAQTSELHYLTW